MASFDVVIVGGGPAGSMAAITAVAGASVLLLEGTGFEGSRIGESLSENALEFLAQVDLLDTARRVRLRQARALDSAWESAKDLTRKFPVGKGQPFAWQIVRNQFDEALFKAAGRAGAKTETSCRVNSVTSAGPDGWDLDVTNLGTLSARVVIDASGRLTTLVRQLGALRLKWDRMISLHARLQPVSATPMGGTNLLVEALEHGWLYSVPLPGPECVVSYQIDSDGLQTATPRQELQEAIASSIHTQKRCSEWVLPDDSMALRATDSSVFLSLPCAGENWIAAGDAAFTMDPLSGDGIGRGMRSGQDAGQTALEILQGRREAAFLYDSRHQAQFNRQMLERNIVYGLAYMRPRNRLRGPFWTRRFATQQPRPMGDSVQRKYSGEEEITALYRAMLEAGLPMDAAGALVDFTGSQVKVNDAKTMLRNRPEGSSFRPDQLDWALGLIANEIIKDPVAL